jgi:hypothetical protein
MDRKIAMHLQAGQQISAPFLPSLAEVKKFELYSKQLVATKDSRVLIHRLDARGQPGCFSLYPHKYGSRRADRWEFNAWAAVHVQRHDDFVQVANLGGFVRNVQVDNLLVVQPTPRNRALADAFKRDRLVERTGRGVNIIYAGQRNGRRPPDYASNKGQISAILDSRPADLDFAETTLIANRCRKRA